MLAESPIEGNQGATKPLNAAGYQPRQPPRHSGRLTVATDERQVPWSNPWAPRVALHSVAWAGRLRDGHAPLPVPRSALSDT
jgi:hypothetical protein